MKFVIEIEARFFKSYVKMKMIMTKEQERKILHATCSLVIKCFPYAYQIFDHNTPNDLSAASWVALDEEHILGIKALFSQYPFAWTHGGGLLRPVRRVLVSAMKHACPSR